MKKTNLDLLVGKWDVEGVYEYVREKSKWRHIAKYEPGYVVWEFTKDGKLYSRHTGEKYYTTGYYYHETSKLLVIDLAYYKALGYTRFRLMDFYRMDYVLNGLRDSRRITGRLINYSATSNRVKNLALPDWINSFCSL